MLTPWKKLETEGVKVIPKPAALRIIKNKIIQKEFYKEHSIPSPAFTIVQNKQELNAKLKDWLPAVQKLGEGGYDGRGVQIIQSAADVENGFDAPSVLEKKIDIHKEIAVIVIMNEKGESASFPLLKWFSIPISTCSTTRYAHPISNKKPYGSWKPSHPWWHVSYNRRGYLQ